MSLIGVYIPIYLLTLHYSFPEVIAYYALSHLTGLFLTLFVYVPFMQKKGIVNTFKLYFPLQIAQLLLLQFLPHHHGLLYLAAAGYGATNFVFWIPLNLLFVRHSEEKEMAGNLSKIFALPQIFSIVGPLISAVLIPRVGFWPVFMIAIAGLIVSYIPVSGIAGTEFKAHFNFAGTIDKFRKRKTLFVFEIFDNIVEDSEWYWKIYVFLLIGSLAVPGYVGSLEAVGGALFTFFAGHYVKRQGKRLIPLATLLIIIASISRMLVGTPTQAFVVTVASSFALTFFLVTYFTSILKTIKNDDEEEFIILREIPTVMGRMVVFAVAYATISNPKTFFFLPIAASLLILLLYIFKQKNLRA